jgi:hypothetical protein
MEYRDASKKAEKALKELVSSYEHELAAKLKQNPKLFCSYVHQKQNTNESVRLLQSKHGEFVYDRVQIAELLNENFSSIFTIDDDLEHPQFGQKTNLNCEETPSAIFKLIDVKQRLQKLNAFKSCGIDGVHSSVLKNCADALAYPLYLKVRALQKFPAKFQT